MSQSLYEQQAVLAVINPQSINNTNVSSTYTYVDMAKYKKIQVIALLGATDCTVDVALFASAASNGGSPAAISGKSITQFSATDDNKQAVINLDATELAAGYRYVSVKITASNATAALVAAVILGGESRTGPASDNDTTTVAQIIA